MRNFLHASPFTEDKDKLLEGRLRDYSGLPHTYQGAYGQRRLDGVTMRDVGDAVTVAVKDMLQRLGKAEQIPEIWTVQVLHNIELVLADGASAQPQKESPPMWPVTVIKCACGWEGSATQLRPITMELRGCGACGRHDRLKRTQEPRPMGWGSRSLARILQLPSETLAPEDQP